MVCIQHTTLATPSYADSVYLRRPGRHTASSTSGRSNSTHAVSSDGVMPHITWARAGAKHEKKTACRSAAGRVPGSLSQPSHAKGLNTAVTPTAAQRRPAPHRRQEYGWGNRHYRDHRGQSAHISASAHMRVGVIAHRGCAEEKSNSTRFLFQLSVVQKTRTHLSAFFRTHVRQRPENERIKNTAAQRPVCADPDDYGTR